MKTLEELMVSWSGDAVIWRYDRPAEAWIFIALHDTRFGPASGGTRVKSYGEPAEALLDAQRLAEGMTHKWRGIGLHKGGGKAVLAVPESLDGAERDALLLRYADLIERLGGAFATGPDMGTTAEDMVKMATRTRWIHGLYGNGKALDPGPYTARGVLHGIEAAVAAVFGSPELTERTILVEGIGGVGLPLARELSQKGARVLISDLDEARALEVATEIGAHVVPAATALTTPCDVFAPCAVGARLNADTIPGLRCRIVAGSANNQLETPEDADRLHQRGILYAPDYVINGGGALIFAGMDVESDTPPSMEPLRRIGDRLAEIFAGAKQCNESPARIIARMIS